ncbi:MAG: hypothetical protein ACRBF0_16935 [Calditrichia bacterium]
MPNRMFVDKPTVKQHGTPRSMSTQKKGPKTQAPSLRNKVIFSIIILAVILALAEVLTRSLLSRPGYILFPPEQPEGLLIPHPEREYAYAPNFEGKMIAQDYSVSIKTNSIGLRDAMLDSLVPVSILAVGNSFTAGFGVEQAEAWPAQLQARLTNKKRVLNAGVSGYGLRQIRQHIEELLPIVQPEALIVGVYASRYWRVESPYTYFNGMAVGKNSIADIRLVNDGMLVSPFKTPWLRKLDIWLDEHFYFGAHLIKVYHNMRRSIVRKRQRAVPPEPHILKPIVRPLLEELAEIDALSKQFETDLLVLLVNHQETDGSFSLLEQNYNAVVKAYCDSLQMNYFDPLPKMAAQASGRPIFRFPNDHHWSAAAHSFVAEKIVEVLF